MTHFIFDVDDVLLDWEAGFLDWLDPDGTKIDRTGPKTWCLAEWIGNGCTTDQVKAWVIEFNNSEGFGQLKARPSARELIWDLRNAGHTISVLTACGTSRDVARARSRNLYEQFASQKLLLASDDPYGWDDFTDIHFVGLGSSKFNYLFAMSTHTADLVFVEDSFEHAKSGVANGIKSYCLRRSHNRQQEAENPDTQVIWIDDLDAIRLDFIPANQPNVEKATDDRIGRCNRCGTALKEESDGWSDCPRCHGSY